uniref:Uncharacterized protein n=1 Tax=Glossina austeni TaxID=7395 RepID=A0A1A9VVJ4_GLOAU
MKKIIETIDDDFLKKMITVLKASPPDIIDPSHYIAVTLLTIFLSSQRQESLSGRDMYKPAAVVVVVVVVVIVAVIVIKQRNKFVLHIVEHRGRLYDCLACMWHA